MLEGLMEHPFSEGIPRRDDADRTGFIQDPVDNALVTKGVSSASSNSPELGFDPEFWDWRCPFDQDPVGSSSLLIESCKNLRLLQCKTPRPRQHRCCHRHIAAAQRKAGDEQRTLLTYLCQLFRGQKRPRRQGA